MLGVIVVVVIGLALLLLLVGWFAGVGMGGSDRDW